MVRDSNTGGDHAHEIDRQEDHDDRDEENGVDEDECEQEYSDTFSQNTNKQVNTKMKEEILCPYVRPSVSPFNHIILLFIPLFPTPPRCQ